MKVADDLSITVYKILFFEPILPLSAAAVAAAAAGAAGAQVRQSSADPLGLGGNILPLMALGGNTGQYRYYP